LKSGIGFADKHKAIFKMIYPGKGLRWRANDLFCVDPKNALRISGRGTSALVRNWATLMAA